MKKLMFSLIIWVLSFTFVQAQTWEKEYEFLGENNLIAIGCETKTGYILFGSTKNKLYLLKIRKESGDTIWVKENEFSEGSLGIQELKEMDNGNLLLIGGISLFDGPGKNLIVITDSLGNILKKKIWSEENNTSLGYLVENGDNTYTVMETSSFGFNLIKFDKNLEIIWYKEHHQGYGISTLSKNEQGYLATGYSILQNGYLPYSISFDQNGNFVWKKYYLNISFRPIKISETDNGFLISGTSVTPSRYKYPAAFKINKQGDFIWINKYLLDSSTTGRCFNTWEINNKYVSVVMEGSYGDENCKAHIVFLDTLGNIINNHDLEKKEPITSFLTTDKHIIISGREDYSYPWVLKFNPIIVQIKDPVIQGFCLKQNYPNPFNAQTFIPFTIDKDSWVNLSIYNSMGKKVKEWSEHFSKGNHKIKFNAEKFNSGIYFYQIKTETRTQTRKMLLIK